MTTEHKPSAGPSFRSGLNGEAAKAAVADAMLGQSLLEVRVLSFWLHGELVDPATVLFIRTSNEWLRVFFDGPLFFFRAVDAPEDSSSPDSIDSDGFDFRVTPSAIPPGLDDRLVERIEFRDSGRELVLQVHFTGGGTFVLRNDRDERNSVWWVVFNR